MNEGGRTILTILFAVGLLVAFWFIAHAAPLRFFVVSSSPKPKRPILTSLFHQLFMGTMSSLYSVWVRPHLSLSLNHSHAVYRTYATT